MTTPQRGRIIEQKTEHILGWLFLIAVGAALTFDWDRLVLVLSHPVTLSLVVWSIFSNWLLRE